VFEIGRPPQSQRFFLNHLKRYSGFSRVTIKTNWNSKSRHRMEWSFWVGCRGKSERERRFWV